MSCFWSSARADSEESNSSSRCWISGFSVTGQRNPRTALIGFAAPRWFIRLGTGVLA